MTHDLLESEELEIVIVDYTRLSVVSGLTALLAHPVVAVLRCDLITLPQSRLAVQHKMEVTAVFDQVKNIY